MPTPEPKKLPSKGSSEGSPHASHDVTPAIAEYTDAMMEAWNVVNGELPQARGVEKLFNSVGHVQNAMTPSDGQQAVVDTLAVPAKALMDTPQIANIITEGVNSFMDVVPGIVKALDGLAKIHPFIEVAVSAFKAVYALELTRRSNDQRVITIYVEMKNMMAVLIQLEGVSDVKKKAPNGRTIEGRLEKLCIDVAKDITLWEYLQHLPEWLLTKIFSGSAWGEQLVGFVEVFARRREDFILALSIHTVVAVGEVNVKLDAIEQRTAEMIQRVEVIAKLIQEKFVTPEQRQLAFLIKQKGGDAVIYDKDAMEELWNQEAVASALVGNEKLRSTKTFNLEEVLCEIRGDPIKAIEKNEKHFNDILHLQTRQIQECVDRAMELQGDRIISAVNAGQHDRVEDPDLRQIWKDMGWRGSVKARHFVLALKDHFEEMVAGNSRGAANLDEWALEYININCVRRFMEAFDGDGSGFITVKEANDFTRSRPQGWSLLHWLAYWAIGWQMTCTNYCKKIEEIFDAMIHLSGEVLPENRTVVNEYISYAWTEVGIFTRSIQLEEGTDKLRARFQSYVDAEEEGLRKNFEDIKYDLDGYDSVRLVSGHGRIETTLFPMLYLLLQRDLQKINPARKRALSDPELLDHLDTIQWVTGIVQFRVGDMRATFEQQGLPPKEQFAVHAKGLFSMYSDGARDAKLRALLGPIPSNTEIILSQDPVPSSVLNYSIGDDHEADFAAYDSPTPRVPPPGNGPDAVLGTYHGAGPSTRDGGENSVVASGTPYDSRDHGAYTLTGTTRPVEGGKIPVNLRMEYSKGWRYITMTGHFDIAENSLKGTFTWRDGWSGEFVFKRDPDLVRFYPAPCTIDARARWKFATGAVLDRIRQESWSTSYILKRIKDWKCYVELGLKDQRMDLEDDERGEYRSLLSSLREADVQFYASRINAKLGEVIIHLSKCDSCDTVIGGARVLCMDCHSNDTLDLCSEPECLDSVITSKGRPDLEAPHTPNHDMLKAHQILFDRDTARTKKNARDALKAVRSTVSDLEAKGGPMPECICCQNVVSLPCWCCVDCAGKKFICADCGYKCLAFNGAHTRKHTLVRVAQKVEKSKISMEERLEAVEGRLGSVEGQLGSVKGQLGSVEGQLGSVEIRLGSVEGRLGLLEGRLGSIQDELSKVNQLLSKLFAKGNEGSPDDPLTKDGALGAAIAEPSPGGPLPPRGEGDGGVDEERG